MGNASQVNTGTNLRIEWERFISHGIMPKGVRAAILQSWLRSKRLDVDPYGGKSGRVLSIVELKRRIRDNELLIKIVQEILKGVCWTSSSSGYLFYLTDQDANLLYICGDKKLARDFELNINFGVGVNWGEQAVGTTAVSVALMEKIPVFWISEEKYCFLLKETGCACAPIQRKDGSVAGILGAATDFAGLGKADRPVYDFLLTAAFAVQACLRQLEIERDFESTTKRFKAVIDEISDGIIITDKNGLVVNINKGFGSLFGVDITDGVGKHAGSAFPQANFVLDRTVLPGGKNKFYEGCIVGRSLCLENESGTREYLVGIFQKYREQMKARSETATSSFSRANIVFDDIMGKSVDMMRVKSSALIAAKENYEVVIQGETGTGKEMFAQAIHNASRRANRPFIAINCGALPGELIESELFGYEGGAFTGARPNGCPGKFEMADGGTLFLDEIGEMPLKIQVKLLRVLQEMKFMRVGSSRAIAVDVRVIAATNRDLEEMVRNGDFRDDLYWRLNVLALRIPALVERQEDIPDLISHFLEQHVKERGLKYTLSDGAYNMLISYHWPGNVRELENVLKRAVVYAEDGLILPEHLPEYLTRKEVHQVSEALDMPLQDAERGAILRVLESSKGNLSRTAKILGISRATLYSKIKRYRIEC